MPERRSAEPAKETATEPKKFKAEIPDNQKDELLKTQESIEELELACAKEQLKIQREFDKKKRPFFEKRDKMMSELGLWPRALLNNEAVSLLVFPEDVEILEKYLSSVSLEDHIDDNGTFEMKLIFKDSVSEVFSPSVLVKRLTYDAEGKEVLDKCTATEVKFVDETNNPIVKAEEAARARNEPNKDSEEDSDSEEMTPHSIFRWFSIQGEGEWAGFAEYFRTVIYQKPLISALGPDFEDSEFASDESDDEALNNRSS
eukprot:Protomagalhaensia_wolfi_Nauph_80__2536@NODE_2697_length_1013_cov_236_967146_g2111_i0_p1_GENE_NODE_2697_length_1013_cov_236_967146_g2111_i0NODE_2697_length_1013_cov_236_967146_g2111_i0_p1_ORF_typecomplete_len267_score72_82NAP/PF00956_18/9_1e02NAP/PF00956_18/4_9e15PRMT5_C/PF17286_2/0_063_NODE_2697_length_1013_cov_236_967146_g2111_i029802